MNINRENYELFILDLLDETISEDVKKELQLFLMENPDIWKDVQGLETTFLKPEPVSYPHKAALKQSVFEDEAYFNEMAVAYLENDITKEDKADFEAYLHTHKAAHKAYRLFALTKLKPDLSVLFPDKDLLYHTTKVIPLFIRFGRIASVAAIFLIALFYFKPWQSRMPHTIAQQEQQMAEISDFSEDMVSDNSGSTIEKEQNSTDEQEQNSTVTSDSDTKKVSATVAQNLTGDVTPVHTAYRSEPAADVFEERIEYKELKPKKAKPTKYIYIIKPTLAANTGNGSSHNEKALQRFAKAGEKLLNQRANIDRQQIEKGVLNVLKLASNDKINYETNLNGKVSRISVNSDLLAFTLPIRKNNKQ